MIFTNEADYLRLVADGSAHAGIVYCHRTKREVGEIIRFLVLMNDCPETEDMLNVIEFI